jgi:hypothetical protein
MKRKERSVSDRKPELSPRQTKEDTTNYDSQEMPRTMKRKPIRNEDKERVIDLLVDKDKDKIVVETNVGRQTKHIGYETFMKQIEQLASAD